MNTNPIKISVAVFVYVYDWFIYCIKETVSWAIILNAIWYIGTLGLCFVALSVYGIAGIIILVVNGEIAPGPLLCIIPALIHGGVWYLFCERGCAFDPFERIEIPNWRRKKTSPPA